MTELEFINNNLKNLEIPNKEKLVRELQNFLIYALKTKKISDNNLIYELLELIVDIENLYDYVKDIESVDWNMSEELGYGAYFPCNHTLIIYLYNIIEEFKDDYNNVEPYLQKLLFFSKIIITCIHEVEHANQLRICLENKKNIETLILRNSMIYLSDKDWELNLINKGYNAFEVPKLIEKQKELEYYSDKVRDINPSERLAEIKSSFLTFLAFSSFLSNYNILEKDLLLYLYDSLIQGYHECNNPTESFVKMYDSRNEWEKINKLANTLTVLEKTAYGLEIASEEKNKLKYKRKKYYGELWKNIKK